MEKRLWGVTGGEKGKEGLKKKFLSLNTVMKFNTVHANSKEFC